MKNADLDRTDWIVVVWLSILTVIVGTAVGVMWLRLSDTISDDQARQQTQISINHTQIEVNTRQTIANCKVGQQAWDRSDRLVRALELAHVAFARQLRAELHARPKCPTLKKALTPIASTTTTTP